MPFTLKNLREDPHDLGSNFDPKVTFSYYGNWERQVELFEHPELIHSRGLEWAPYPSHFAMQGYVFAGIDAVNPMPRSMSTARASW